MRATLVLRWFSPSEPEGLYSKLSREAVWGRKRNLLKKTKPISQLLKLGLFTQNEKTDHVVRRCFSRRLSSQIYLFVESAGKTSSLVADDINKHLCLKTCAVDKCKDRFPPQKREMCTDELMPKDWIDVIASFFTRHKQQASTKGHTNYFAPSCKMFYTKINLLVNVDRRLAFPRICTLAATFSLVLWAAPPHLYMSCFTSARRFLEASYVSGGM